MVHTWLLRSSVSLDARCRCPPQVILPLASCCQLFPGHLAANCKCVATAELILVMFTLSTLLLFHQLFIGRVATEAGPVGLAART